jgi:hypothetical protein
LYCSNSTEVVYNIKKYPFFTYGMVKAGITFKITKSAVATKNVE